jgi:hypothetical protein
VATTRIPVQFAVFWGGLELELDLASLLLWGDPGVHRIMLPKCCCNSKLLKPFLTHKIDIVCYNILHLDVRANYSVILDRAVVLCDRVDLIRIQVKLSWKQHLRIQFQGREEVQNEIASWPE